MVLTVMWHMAGEGVAVGADREGKRSDGVAHHADHDGNARHQQMGWHIMLTVMDSAPTGEGAGNEVGYELTKGCLRTDYRLPMN